MPSVNDVAAYILEQTGQVSTLKLQKLVYYSHGWSLAWDGRPLISERFEAWANGPVCPPLWRQAAGSFHAAHLGGNPAHIDADQRDTIDAVLAFYGKQDGEWLSELSHREPPWKNARGATPAGARSDAPITNEVIRNYFAALGVNHKEIPPDLARGFQVWVDTPPEILDLGYKIEDEDPDELIDGLFEGTAA